MPGIEIPFNPNHNEKENTMKKTNQAVALSVAGLGVAGALTIFAAPAQAAADTRACVTFSEWARVDVGMPRTQVRTVLDGSGNTDADGVGNWYRVCDKPVAKVRAYVFYDANGRMSSGMWLVLKQGTFADS